MGFYAGGVYPAVLAVCGVLALSGAFTLITTRGHRVLEWVVTTTWIATAVQAITVIALLLAGNDAGIVLSVGYVLATILVLPLLGIGRLGAPDAAATDPDPNRPVLQPDQIARVDGGAAVIIAITAAVLAWRLAIIMGAV